MNKLIELRNRKNITQGRMAKNLGITQQAYCNYEKGIRQIPDDLKIKLADYFDVSVDYLLGREQKEKPTGIPEGYDELYQEIYEKFSKKERASKIANLSPENKDILFKTIDSLIDAFKK